MISKVLEARDTLANSKTPVFVKIAPDLDTSDKEDIAAVVMENPKVTTINFGSIKFFWKLGDLIVNK